jgi:hypothetical protein
MARVFWTVTVLLAGLGPTVSLAERQAVTVTVDNFVRAETDMTFARKVEEGAFGTIVHTREMTPVDQQSVIRMNRDTLYSSGLFDLTSPVTVVKPDPGARFQSMLVINQDHSMLPVEHGAGEFLLTREKVGTRFAMVVFRTFANPADPRDMAQAHLLQDRITIRQASKGTFDVPAWEETSLARIREAINVLAASRTSTAPLFGDRAKLNPLDHLMGTAYGWGGNPPEAALYDGVTPALNDGKTPYVLRVRDVPVDGFWSVTVYNEKGFLEPNPANLHSLNNVSAKRERDGGYTIRFGGNPRDDNYLPIMPGWNYTVRMYRPREQLLNGSWSFPAAVPVDTQSVRGVQ